MPGHSHKCVRCSAFIVGWSPEETNMCDSCASNLCAYAGCESSSDDTAAYDAYCTFHAAIDWELV